MFIVSEPDRDPMISSYDRAGNRLRGFLHKGHGPGETRDLLRISLYSNPVVQAPVDPETVFLYELDGLSDGNALPCAEYRLPAGNYAFSSIHAFAENKVLYAGKSTRHRNGSDRRFRIYDADSDELLAFGDYPPEDAAAGFDIADLEKAAIERSVFYRYPSIEAIYVPQLKVHAIRRDPDAPSGFPDGWCSDESLYLLHSGKTFSVTDYSAGKYILKFDWSGTPVYLRTGSRYLLFCAGRKRDAHLCGIPDRRGSRHRTLRSVKSIRTGSADPATTRRSPVRHLAASRTAVLPKKSVSWAPP